MHLADRRWKWRDRRKGLVRAPEEASLENWHRQNQNWLFVVFLVCMMSCRLNSWKPPNFCSQLKEPILFAFWNLWNNLGLWKSFFFFNSEAWSEKQQPSGILEKRGVVPQLTQPPPSSWRWKPPTPGKMMALDGHETRVTNFRGFLGDTNRQGIGVTQPKFPIMRAKRKPVLGSSQDLYVVNKPWVSFRPLSRGPLYGFVIRSPLNQVLGTHPPSNPKFCRFYCFTYFFI